MALVHDYLLVLRGAERTFAAIASCWPDAPIFTLLYDPEAMGSSMGQRRVQTSYLQRLGVRQGNFRRLLPLFPRAVERLPVQEFDVVLSSSSAFAHGVRRGVDATHISYCHSPFRYVWHERREALDPLPRHLRPFARGSLRHIREWDNRVAQGVDHFIANSQLTRSRIQEFWHRDATVLHPPVDVSRFAPASPEGYFLVVGELVAHKRTAVALEAARLANKPIKVVGTGPQLSELARTYAGSAEFVGRVSDPALARLYAGALALVVPNVEEFGIAAVEVQASGRPVLAYDAGGVKETVRAGETGVLLESPTPASFATAMRDVDFEAFDPERIRQHVRGFSVEEFRRRLLAEVDRLTAR